MTRAQSSLARQIGPAGRVIASTDPRGWITRRVYNARGQQTLLIAPGGSITGYRYDAIDPDSGRRWPAMPPVFADLATRAALKPRMRQRIEEDALRVA